MALTKVARGTHHLNIKAYLERINYPGSLAPTAETLRELQTAHLLTVPFENLSIHAHEPIVLADEDLFAKIVERRREHESVLIFEGGGVSVLVGGKIHQSFAMALRELGKIVRRRAGKTFEWC